MKTSLSLVLLLTTFSLQAHANQEVSALKDLDFHSVTIEELDGSQHQSQDGKINLSKNANCYSDFAGTVARGVYPNVHISFSTEGYNVYNHKGTEFNEDELKDSLQPVVEQSLKSKNKVYAGLAKQMDSLSEELERYPTLSVLRARGDEEGIFRVKDLSKQLGQVSDQKTALEESELKRQFQARYQNEFVRRVTTSSHLYLEGPLGTDIRKIACESKPAQGHRPMSSARMQSLLGIQIK